MLIVVEVRKGVNVLCLTLLEVFGQIRRSGYRVTLMLMKMHQLALLTISPVGQ